MFSGRATGPVMNADTGENLWTADFSALRTPGTYFLDVPGMEPSPRFRIAPDLYNASFYTVTRGMYLWRCGMAVSGKHGGQTFSHAACHVNDGYLDAVGGGHVRQDGIGGWHDAGDYNKYVVNAGITRLVHCTITGGDPLERLAWSNSQTTNFQRLRLRPARRSAAPSEKNGAACCKNGTGGRARGKLLIELT